MKRDIGPIWPPETSDSRKPPPNVVRPEATGGLNWSDIWEGLKKYTVLWVMIGVILLACAGGYLGYRYDKKHYPGRVVWAFFVQGRPRRYNIKAGESVTLERGDLILHSFRRDSVLASYVQNVEEER